ncbi:MAG: hypothetical protein WAR21_08755 [Candidatus Acidiferrales bacterium]
MTVMFSTESEENPASTCGAGHFRWKVKILEDADRAQVKLRAVQTTIKDLNAVPKPAEPYPASNRIKPWELQVYRVRARLKAVLPPASDGDIHLFLEDPDNPEEHIVAEIPAPECVRDAVRAEEYRFARRTASALRVDSFVEVTGLGFFDKVNGLPFAKARNGMELHPVFNVRAVRDGEKPSS